ncbi:MAG: neutral zinc metallopeptidase [Verrucomicrobiales bacterium]
MKWKGRRESDRVEDARGDSSPMAGGGMGGGLSTLLTFVLRRFGIKGVLAVLVIGGVMWKMGLIDPSMMLSGGAAPQAEVSAEDEERFQFVKVVLADTEDVWKQEFARMGMEYQLPAMKVYRGRTHTGCGTGDANMGPFYCPADATVYIDLGFYDELAQTFKSPGDFAQAYVIAHEVGHHVQKLLGISDKVAARRGRPDYNEWSVRLELQADYFAGVWAHHNQRYLDHGDIEEAMRAANAIGDDAIQKKMQGRVVPHAFTHGTSEQRMRWFKKGLNQGSLAGGDTFSQAYGDL